VEAAQGQQIMGEGVLVERHPPLGRASLVPDGHKDWQRLRLVLAGSRHFAG
jgi:hypothetical protein